MNKSQLVSILRYALAILGGSAAGVGLGSKLGDELFCPPPVVEVAPVVPVEAPPVAPPVEE